MMRLRLIGLCCAALRRHGAKYHHGSPFEIVRLLGGKPFRLDARPCGVDQSLPALAFDPRRDRERNRFVKGVHENQNRVAADLSAALVDIADQIPWHAQTEALVEAGVPLLLVHRLSCRVEPSDITDVGAENRPTVEKFAPLKYRLAMPDGDYLADKLKKLSFVIVQF